MWFHSCCFFSFPFSLFIFSLNIFSDVFDTLFNVSCSLFNVLFCLMCFLLNWWSCHFMYFLCCSFINFMWNLFDFLPTFWNGGSDILNDSWLFINNFFYLLFSFFPFLLSSIFHLFRSLFDILFFLLGFWLNVFKSGFDIGFESSWGLLNVFSSKFKARMWSDNIEAFLWIFWREGCIHTESFDDNFNILLMFIDISFEIDFFYITHIDGFIHWKWIIIL